MLDLSTDLTPIIETYLASEVEVALSEICLAMTELETLLQL